MRHPNLVRLLPLPGGAGLAPVLGNARRLADFTLPAGTFKRFDLEQVLRLLLDVLSGLGALHEVVTDGRAFVHGQVSPHNIYIDEHGTARLVPLLNAHSINGVKLEDAGYAAPEQLAGRPLDARADVFSVGVMLWEALAGKRLFPDGSAEGLRARLWEGKAPPIRLSPEAHWARPLCALAERAIATDPRARFASALELSNALAAAAAQQLSHVDVGAWQDEAPTPVFQPRLHLATLRSSTPEPAVLTIALEAAPVAEIEARGAVAAERAFQPRRGGRVARGVLWSFAALALGFAGVELAKSPINWRQVAAAAQRAASFTPATARIAAAPAPAPAAASVLVAPPLVLPVSTAAPVASAAETSTAAPAPATSSAFPPRPAKPLAAPGPTPPAPKPKTKAAPDRNNDYGI